MTEEQKKINENIRKKWREDGKKRTKELSAKGLLIGQKNHVKMTGSVGGFKSDGLWMKHANQDCNPS